MKICMIGGTGLLGSQGAQELISRGHEVRAIALPPLPQGAVLPPEMEISYGNYLEMNDDEVKKMFEGCEGFVFAAGIDERVEGPAPIYDLYKKYNIDPVKRLLKIAKECGVKHCVVLGSYFSYFAKARPQMHLTEYHPYIRSRIDQEKVAMSFADDNFDVAVLELPYIFGTQPGRKPVWVFLVESIRKMPGGEKLIATVMGNMFNKLADGEHGTKHFIDDNMEDRIEAYWGSRKAWEALPESYNDFNHFFDWDKKVVLDHGYDETKPESELTLADMKRAAIFRGGECLSTKMEKGDWSTQLEFKCVFGHTFKASPRLVLEGGHWCDECERKSWNYGQRAKVDPFFAQVWEPLHDDDELREYPKEVSELDVK